MYTDILILSILSRADAHGYEIKKKVERITGLVRLNNNILYPALRRFEQDGLIERVPAPAAAPVAGRPPRNVYRITDAGRDALQALLRETDPASLLDDAEFQTRVGFFDHIDAADRVAIIAARREILARRIEHQELLTSNEVGPSWATRIMAFNLEAMRRELAWLEELEAIARR